MENWTLKGFNRRNENIRLFLKLTRKNVNALRDREFSKKFQPTFNEFCQTYEKLEKEYERGITNHKGWAHVMHTLAVTLDSNVHLL